MNKAQKRTIMYGSRCLSLPDSPKDKSGLKVNSKGEKGEESAARWRCVFPQLRHNYSVLAVGPPPLRTLRAARSVCCCFLSVCVCGVCENRAGAVTSPTLSTRTRAQCSK